MGCGHSKEPEEVEELEEDNEVVIAVMGMTGSGKSSFIQRVSEKSSTAVGHGLQSGKKIVLAANVSDLLLTLRAL